jgi:leader peptidase (prepilin peptidase) / N-methyltransferase
VLPLPALLLVVGLLGLAIGSFLNVVIYRVPRGESLVRPGSHCTSCDAPIKAWHNVPLAGWLVLRGHCASCRAPISVRYPLVELGTAALFVLVTWRLDQLDQRAAAPAWLYFTAVGIALAAIDLDTRRLPRSIILPSYAVLAGLLGLAALVQSDWWALLRAALGALALFAFFLALVFVYPAGMGFGDVRLAGLIGAVLAYLSWATWGIGAFAGFLLGAVAGVVLLATRRAGRKTAVPFGPFMIAGTLLALFVADPIAVWYAGLLRF